MIYKLLRNFFLSFLLFCPLLLAGQNIDSLKITTTTSTCFANGTISIEIIGSDAGNLTGIQYIVFNDVDFRSGQIPFFDNLTCGTWNVMVTAQFQGTPITPITGNAYIDCDYEKPVSNIVQHTSEIIGTRKTFNCRPTGRVSIKITDGKWPYFVETYLNSSTTPLKIDTFYTYQNSGNNPNSPDYYLYYNIDELPAGNFKFIIKDGCNYQMPELFETVETVNQDYYCNNIRTYSTENIYDFNVVRIEFFIMYPNDELFMYYYDQRYRNIPWWEFEYSYNGDLKKDWIDIPANMDYYDTVSTASKYCDIWGDEYEIKVRVKECIEPACMVTRIVEPVPPHVIVNLSNLKFDEMTGCPENYLNIDFCVESCNNPWDNKYFTAPLHYTITNLTTDEIWADNIEYARIWHYETPIDSTQIGEPLHIIVYDANNCLLIDSIYFIPPPPPTYWFCDTYYRLCEDDNDRITLRYVDCYSLEKPPENTIIELIESPDDTYYFKATYNRNPLNEWSFTYNNIIDTMFANSPNCIIMQSKDLLSGTYRWTITDTCGRKDTIQRYCEFWWYEIEDSLTYQTEVTCEGTKYFPEATLVRVRKDDGYRDYSDRIHYYFINGITGGYYPTGGELNVVPFTLYQMGTYVLGFQGWRDLSCLIPYDTITYIYNGLALTRAYGYACRSAEGEVSIIEVEVDPTTGVAPYQYVLYTLDGVPIDTNYTGTFYYGEPDSTYKVIITDQCGTIYPQTIQILSLSTENIAYAENTYICEGDPVYFHTIPILGDQIEYYWEGPGGFTSEESDPIIPVSTMENDGCYYLSITGLECEIKDTVCINIIPPITEYISDSICEGDSYDFYGQFLTETGTYIDTLTAVLTGCDSIVTLNLTVNPVYNIPIFDSICEGDFYDFHGQFLTTTGTYIDTLSTIYGCDSIVTLNLTVNPVYTLPPIFDSICEGDSYDFHGQFLTTTGTYIDTLSTIYGCDSIVTLNLTVNPVYTLPPIFDSICEGDSYEFHGQFLTTTGIYIDTLSTIYNCDSIVTLNLTVNPVYNILIPDSICEGDSYDFHGQFLTESGTYIDTLSTIYGCDSIVTLTLTVNPVYYNIPIFDSICKGDSYDFHGQFLTEEGVYIDTLSTIYGCDSIIVLTLAINPVYSTPISATICDNDSYDFFGQFLTVAGTYTDTLSTIYGCDSVIVLTLDVTNTQFSIGEVDEICANATSFCVPVNLESTEMIYYDIQFNRNAIDEKFENFSSSIIDKNCIEVKIPYNPKDSLYYVTPHSSEEYYKGYLSVNDGKCFSDTLEFPFKILYPTWIIEQKWNDVIVVVNNKYNHKPDGFTFSKYEWFKNGTKNTNRLENENYSYIYIMPTLDLIPAEYRARLTRFSDGESCFTCPLIPVYHAGMSWKVYPTLLNSGDPIYIETIKDGVVRIWNVKGSLIAQYPVYNNKINIISVKATGVLLLEIVQNDGFRRTFKIIVN